MIALTLMLDPDLYPWEAGDGWGENHYFCSSLQPQHLPANHPDLGILTSAYSMADTLMFVVPAPIPPA